MRATLIIFLALTLGACGGHDRRSLAIGAVHAKTSAPLALTSDAFQPNAAIDLRHSGVGQNLSPGLRWTRVPGAGSYAIVMQDSDSPSSKPFVHWMIWNIPGDATTLTEGVANQPTLVIPDGARQGANDNGAVGYYGPAPPSGTHHYHFQLFALDAPLTVPAGANLDVVVAGMQGHVLADAELIGTYSAGGGR